MSPVTRAATRAATSPAKSPTTGRSTRIGPCAAARTLAALTLGAVLSVAPFASRAAGDAAAGKEKAATCAACHGADGIAVASNYPTLAGQYESYLVQSLKAYRSGARQNAIMAGFATQLSDEDIADLAAWFASQPGPLQTAPRP